MENSEINLRNEFAIEAMTALIRTIPWGECVSSKSIAKSSYIIADAMMKRHKK